MYKNIFIAMIVAALMLAGCSSKKDTEQAKNMDQLYQENGLPVKIQQIEARNFSKELTYNATLSGIRETSEYASFGAEVETIKVHVGDFVEKDQVLVTFPEDTPVAQYEELQAMYDNVRTTYERMQKLYEVGGISKQDLDNAETQYKVYSSKMDALGKMLMAQAPISGIVTAIDVRVSDNVNPGDLLFTISDVSRMKARVWVTDTEMRQLQPGMNAHARWEDLKLDGRITRVSLAMDNETQAFAVDMEFDNPTKAKYTGVTAEISLETYANPKAIVVERKSVLSDEKGHYVFIEKGGVAQKARVTVGTDNNLDLEITGGLNPGDHLIIQGLHLLHDGQKINVLN